MDERDLRVLAAAAAVAASCSEESLGRFDLRLTDALERREPMKDLFLSGGERFDCCSSRRLSFSGRFLVREGKIDLADFGLRLLRALAKALLFGRESRSWQPSLATRLRLKGMLN